MAQTVSSSLIILLNEEVRMLPDFRNLLGLARSRRLNTHYEAPQAATSTCSSRSRSDHDGGGGGDEWLNQMAHTRVQLTPVYRYAVTQVCTVRVRHVTLRHTRVFQRLGGKIRVAPTGVRTRDHKKSHPPGVPTWPPKLAYRPHVTQRS